MFDEERALPLKHFPRVWYICLSKADLLPDWTLERFGGALDAAGDEMRAIERVLKKFVKEKESIDFRSGLILLSSLKCDPKTMKVVNWEATRGVELIAPLSFFSPIFRAFRVEKVKDVSKKALKIVLKGFGELLSSLGPIASAVLTIVLAPISLVPIIGPLIASGSYILVGVAVSVMMGAGRLLVLGGDALNVSGKKLSALDEMLRRFSFKILEGRTFGTCQVSDMDFYDKQRK